MLQLDRNTLTASGCEASTAPIAMLAAVLQALAEPVPLCESTAMVTNMDDYIEGR